MEGRPTRPLPGARRELAVVLSPTPARRSLHIQPQAWVPRSQRPVSLAVTRAVCYRQVLPALWARGTGWQLRPLVASRLCPRRGLEVPPCSGEQLAPTCSVATEGLGAPLSSGNPPLPSPFLCPHSSVAGDESAAAPWGSVCSWPVSGGGLLLWNDQVPTPPTPMRGLTRAWAVGDDPSVCAEMTLCRREASRPGRHSPGAQSLAEGLAEA